MIPVVALSLGVLNQRATLAFDKIFNRAEYIRRSETLRGKIACRVGTEPSWENKQFYDAILTAEEAEELLQLECFLNKELGQLEQ